MNKYESPIKIIWNDMQTQFDDDVVRCIQSYNINVNKEELVKALNYDRKQYNKGYEDAEKYYQKALYKACELIVDRFGTCPLEMFDYDVDCENCNDETINCWEDWLLNEEVEDDKL